MVENHPAQKVN